ncbi:MAG TPA: glycosyltransferase family 2 protein [Blastocatellia bacterium]|nr:glycosyltransferase family 2 protein [Blastocatellia bacterium]
MKCLLIIPAYNEAENITSVISEIRSLHPFIDIVVVDDGSSDATSWLADRAGVKVLKLPFNLGYGAAVQTGLIYGVEYGYDLCVLIDGDGQHDPQYISDLIAPIEARHADIALGSRFLGKADYSIPLARRLGILLFRQLASMITRQQITDPTSGFQAINRRLMKFFVNDNYPHDFPDADTLIRLYFAGFKIKEVPVTIRPRLRGESMHGGGAKTLYYVYKMLFSIFIALTQRRILMKGETDAFSNESHDGSSLPVSDDDDNSTSAAKTT